MQSGFIIFVPPQVALAYVNLYRDKVKFRRPGSHSGPADVSSRLLDSTRSLPKLLSDGQIIVEFLQ